MSLRADQINVAADRRNDERTDEVLRDDCVGHLDERACEEFTNRMFRPLVRFVVDRYRLGHEDGQDVALEAVLVALRDYDPSRGRIRTFAYIVAGSRAQDAHSAYARRDRLVADKGHLLGATATAPSAEDAAAIGSSALRHCQEKLTPGLRRVAELLLEGFTEGEIAALLKVPPGTVYVRKHRAIGKLRECLKVSGEDPWKSVRT